MKNLIQYIGTPYEELDCWGLVRTVYGEQLHIELPALPIQEQERHNWSQVKPGKELSGDLILFRIRELKRHVGIIIGDQKMIHADEKLGVVVERYNADPWQHKIERIYRHARSH